MRVIFLAITFVLLQIITYGVVCGLQWQFDGLGDLGKRWLAIGLFGFGNTLLALAMMGFTKVGFRLLMAWQTLLWFFLMAILATVLLNTIFSQFFGKFYISVYQDLGIKILPMVIFLFITIKAVYNAYTPVVRYLQITPNQALSKPTKIALVADLHLGFLVGKRQLNKLVKIVQANKAELLLIPGDVLDDDTVYYERENMHVAMTKLVESLPLGVYATLGNHDVFGHEHQITTALQQAGVKTLLDETVRVDERLYLVGRLDDLAKTRKPTAELLPKVIDKPVVLLDHRPGQIDENVKLPIDLQVSGHTHNGQIFPANFIVKYLNTVAYGHKRINNTDVLVTSGYGFWGMPFRLGSQSEVWIIDLQPKSAF
ncbi:metallophosphoesterase [Moraxella macacae 0408225]|uniref:Metallophosphoesterase n=1 Tax=Moraxella macacae 0408225 TaxID=1230338 RepID=L2F600_9GAMM|nr:metallophosphoesterase [Moraxella macacae]ELA08484.1 metallophosphoesterase [Moraxella macacae 0408225]